MTDILSHIRAYKLKEIEKRKSSEFGRSVYDQAMKCQPTRGFIQALSKKQITNRMHLIAEIKQASPSKGLIRDNFDPAALAKTYQHAGATCLSVLTDAPSFKGHENDLRAARASVDIPILRKDFIFDPWQVFEARAIGADCILVILAAVDQKMAQTLVNTAHDLGLDVLIEVHTRDEMLRALDLPTRLIGINNRDLRTFEIDLRTTESLSAMAKKNHLIISESGLSTSSDLKRIKNTGVDGVLIGESLMSKHDVFQATQNLLSWC